MIIIIVIVKSLSIPFSDCACRLALLLILDSHACNASGNLNVCLYTFKTYYELPHAYLYCRYERPRKRGSQNMKRAMHGLRICTFPDNSQLLHLSWPVIVSFPEVLCSLIMYSPSTSLGDTWLTYFSSMSRFTTTMSISLDKYNSFRLESFIRPGKPLAKLSITTCDNLKSSLGQI